MKVLGTCINAVSTAYEDSARQYEKGAGTYCRQKQKSKQGCRKSIIKEGK